MLLAVQIIAAINVLIFVLAALVLPFAGRGTDMPPILGTLVAQGLTVLPSVYVLTL